VAQFFLKMYFGFPSAAPDYVYALVGYNNKAGNAEFVQLYLLLMGFI